MPMSGLINGANLVGGLIRQGQQTQDYIGTMFDEAARRKAGARMVAGDYTGAAGELAGRGMLEDASVMQGQGTTRDVMGAMDTGDYAGARAAAARGGDPKAYAGVRDEQDRERKERAAFMGQGAEALSLIKGPNPAATAAKRKQAFGEFIAPALKSMGMSDADVAQMGGGDFSDQSIVSFRAALGQLEAMDIKVDADTGEVIGTDKTTGEVKVLRLGTPKPIVLSRGDKLVSPDGDPIASGAGEEGRWVERTKPDGSTEWFQLPASGQPAAGGGATPQGAPRATPAPSGGIYDQIATIAAQNGAEPEEITYLRRLAQVESNGDPAAKNGSSTGVFQFHPDTFASVGGTNIRDPADQTRAALALARQDREKLQRMGIEPTDANLYIMHQQGAGGGPALLNAPPEVNAVSALTPAYGGNATRARQAITGNGGRADMTAGEFVEYWQDRWSGGGRQAAKPSASPSRPVAGDAPRTLTPAQQMQQSRSDRTFEAGMRDDFRQDPAIKNYGDVDSSYRTLRALTSRPNPTPSDDTALTFAYLKMLDPGSVVREGEYALVGRAAGVPDRILIALNKIDEGKGLTAGIRADIIQAAESVYRERRTSYDASVTEYRRIAQESGIDPDKIVKEGGLPRSDVRAAPAQGQPTPAQRAAAQRIVSARPAGTHASGDRANPYVPHTQAEFDRIPDGKWVIDDDGVLIQKGR